MNAIDSDPASATFSTGNINVSAIKELYEDSTQRCRPGKQESRRGLDLGTQNYEGKLHAKKLQSDAECSGSVPAIPARLALERSKAQASRALQNDDTSEVCEAGSSLIPYDKQVQELESRLASAQEDVSRISARHKECDEEIQRLRGEVATLRRAKIEIAENALESITEMNDHIEILKSQIKTVEQQEIELREDLRASRARERILIRQIEKLGDTVMKASKELQQDCEYQIRRRKEFHGMEGHEQLDRGTWNPAQTNAACQGTPVEVDRQSEHDSESAHEGSVFDSTAMSTSPRGSLTSTYTELTADADNEQDQNGVDSTVRKDHSHYLNSTKTSRLKTNAKGSKDRLALRRNNNWTNISV